MRIGWHWSAWRSGRLWRDRRRGPAIALLIAALCLAYGAQAALRAIAAHPRPDIAAAPPAAGFEAEDHFPGAAYFYAAEDQAAPAAGSTGTASLPALALPASAATSTPDATIHPAAPFSMRAANAEDRLRALQCLATAIYYEAASEPDAGQRAVAQVILNRVRHPAFPATVCGVVYQGSEKAGCQFSFACDGAMARKPAPALWRRAMGVAADALSGQVFAPVGLATHYHTYAVTPAWNRQLVMTAAIGAHFFHRWQGWWGTPAAFSQIYRGGEPLPGPKTPVPADPLLPAMPSPLLATRPDTSTPAASPSTAPTAVRPAYVASGTPLPRYSTKMAATAGSDDSQILDKWKDSGKPLK